MRREAYVSRRFDNLVAQGGLHLFALLASEDVAVCLHELAYQQEAVDGGDAVADQMGYEFAFAARLLRGYQIMPKCADLA